MSKAKRTPKRSTPLEDARECWNFGLYQISDHAFERQVERSINDLDIEEILMNGWHERRKDQYRTDWKNWTYAIRGETSEERELRIAICFDQDGMLIVTVIDLDELGEL